MKRPGGKKISWRFHIGNKQKASAPKTASSRFAWETASCFGHWKNPIHFYAGIVSNKKILAAQ